MADIVTTIDGELVNTKSAKISVFDNALMYGEGLFEMFLGVDDRVVFGNEHIRRLYKGARLIDLTVPVSKTTLNNWMRKTLRLQPDHIKKLRLTVTGGLSAKWFGKQGKPQIILNAGPHTIPEAPFRLLVTPFRLDERSEFRRVKTLSYTIHAASLKLAHSKGYDDALLLNNGDNVAEATSANIFWVENGRIFTPPLTSGCLEGTTRHIVFRECRKLGLPPTERDAGLATICSADEVFISSSTKLVLGVSKIRNGRNVCNLSSGPVTQLLFTHFRKLVGIE